MAGAATTRSRSSSKVWLLGMPNKDLLGSGLPANGDVLRNLMFHLQETGLGVNQSARATIDSTLAIWDKARIPTQRVDNCIRKLKGLYEQYCKLKKNRLNPKEGCRYNEDMFRSDLDELFDISRKDALNTMRNEEDKQFLVMQQQDTKSSSMSGTDKLLAEKESRKRSRIQKETIQKKAALSAQQEISVVSSETAISDSDINGSSSESSDDYEGPSTSSQPKLKKQKIIIIMTKEVAASLDRINLPSRGAMFVMGTVVEALGHNLEEVSLSRNTIERARRSTRAEVATEDQATFSPEGPMLLHWDGKLLPDIANSAETVDRIAILVTNSNIEKLLGVPKIGRGTGQEQCNACIQTLESWDLISNIEGMVFDTTAANTGLKNGACTLLEKALNKELVWIGCRLHVFEVMLSQVFHATLGTSSGHEIQLLKRFQKNWTNINKSQYKTAEDELFVDMPESLRQEMIAFFADAMKMKSPRDDYRELLQLCYVFLGGHSEEEPSFRKPGALHNARWMAKAIYSLKMFLFMDQISLTKREKAGLTKFCLFVSLI